MKKISFTEAFIKSLVLHGTIIGLLLVHYWLPWWDHFEVVDVKVIQNAVRVDVVGMPDKTLKELKMIDLSKVAAPPKESAVQPKIEPKKEIVETESKAKHEYQVSDTSNSLKNLLKDFSKRDIKPNKAQQKTELKTDSKTKNELRQLIVSGNRLSEGTDSTGETADNLDPQSRYGLVIQSKVRPYWRLPAVLRENKNLRCKINVFVGSDGRLLKYKIAEPSGNEDFDQAAVESVERAAPFPVPAEEIRGKTLAFRLDFPL